MPARIFLAAAVLLAVAAFAFSIRVADTPPPEENGREVPVEVFTDEADLVITIGRLGSVNVSIPGPPKIDPDIFGKPDAPQLDERPSGEIVLPPLELQDDLSALVDEKRIDRILGEPKRIPDVSAGKRRRIARCFARTPDLAEATVNLAHDVDPEGKPQNIAVLAASTPCFGEIAADYLATFRWNPRLERGEALWSYGLEASIVFLRAD
ncbi:MAG: hypothetical protein AAGH41_11415 [Pseudomonadota bacterium]